MAFKNEQTDKIMQTMAEQNMKLKIESDSA